MIIRAIIIATLLLTNSATSYAFETEQRALIGVKLQNSKPSYFISLEQNEANHSFVPDMKARNIQHKIHFSNTLNYQGNQTNVSHLEGVNYRFSENDINNNSAHYSGYRNVEGFKNRTSYRKKKFAASAIAGGALIVGVVVGTIVAIVNAI